MYPAGYRAFSYAEIQKERKNEMKSFEEFKQMVADTIKTYLPEEYGERTVRISKIVKPNGVVLTGVCVPKDDAAAPTVCLEPYYNYLWEDAPEEKFVEAIKKIADTIKQNEIFDVNEIDKFLREHWSTNVYLELVNTEKSRDCLQYLVRRDILDLSVIYHIRFYIGEEDGDVCVTKALQERLGVTEEELYDSAMRNTSDETQFIPVSAALRAFGMPMTKEDIDPLIIVTNKDNCRGAACILSQRMTQILKELQKDLYVIPSSIHEVMILPVELGDKKNLSGLIPEVNGKFVSQTEFLSDNLYILRYQTGELEIA